MNQNLRTKALLAGICMAFLASGVPSVFAANTGDNVDAVQQTGKITGTVVDNTGESIIGANVIIKGTTVGTITDFDGNFTIDARPGQTLEISSLVTQQFRFLLPMECELSFRKTHRHWRNW